MAGRLSRARMRTVCDELAKGRSLRSICDTSTAMPAWSTVLQTVQRDEDALTGPLHGELSDVLGEVRALLDHPDEARRDAARVALRARIGGGR